MATIRILSGGAAQAVVERITPVFERDTGHTVTAEFSAVGAMAAKLVAGEPADIVILTAALIDELTAKDWVVPGPRGAGIPRAPDSTCRPAHLRGGGFRGGALKRLTKHCLPAES